METKRFELRVLLTVTTGRLLTKRLGERDNGIGSLYEILGWMTDDSPFTHQLPRFGEECKPWLRRWFPELSVADLPDEQFDAMLTNHGIAGVERWMETLIAEGLPSHFDVPKIPRDDHDRKNPFDELVEMRGTDEGIILVKP